jgi:hypothetical protein
VNLGHFLNRLIGAVWTRRRPALADHRPWSGDGAVHGEFPQALEPVATGSSWEQAVEPEGATAQVTAPAPAPAPRTSPPVPGSAWWWPPDYVVRPPKPAPPRPPATCWEEPRKPAPLARAVVVDWYRLQVVVEGAAARELWQRFSFQRLTHQMAEPLSVYQSSREQRRWHFTCCDHGQAVGIATQGERAVLLTSCPECAASVATAPAPAAAV